jgi:hypothetical protein
MNIMSINVYLDSALYDLVPIVMLSGVEALTIIPF